MQIPNEINIVGHVRAGGGGNDTIHQIDWVYSETGICCTLRSCMYKDPPRIFIRRKNESK